MLEALLIINIVGISFFALPLWIELEKMPKGWKRSIIMFTFILYCVPFFPTIAFAEFCKDAIKVL